jgi:hypothetical protein
MINFLTLMELIAKALRFFLPWIGRIIIFMVSFILTSVVSFWGGVPATANSIANEWLDRAVAAGFPTQWDGRLYFTFYYLALLMVVVGWVVLSFITVWIVNLIFR